MLFFIIEINLLEELKKRNKKTDEPTRHVLMHRLPLEQL